jgi:allantoinase
VPSDLVIRGATVVLPGVFPVVADVAITDGAIEAIGPELPGASEELDARGLHLLPGVIDAHVHFNEPGRTDWEGWATGTRALAAGGATACIEMPLNAHPPTIDGAAFDAKVAAASAVARVDFALWGGLVPGNLDQLDELAERGVVGFKAFMCDSGIEDFPAVDDDVLEAGMRRAAALGLPVLVHAERPSALRQPDGTTWRDFVASRPVEAELQAIEVALELAERTGCSLHVVHVSNGTGVALVAAGEATCETCPHYLTLTEDDLETLGARAKCAPPLRPAAERDALWEHLVAGRIAFVASDHSPCPPELKAGDFTAAWGGIAGCQSMLGLLLDAGRLPLGQVAALTSANVAKRFNLPKGRLEPGADADLVLVDLRERHAPDLQDRHKLSPYAGRPLPRIVRTWVRGGAREGRLVTPRKDPA